MTKICIDYRGFRIESEIRGDCERVAVFRAGREVMTAANVGKAKEWIRTQVPTTGLGLHVVDFPNGRFGFVGSVPRELDIIHADGSQLSDEEFREYKQASNPGMVKKRCRYKTPLFDTRVEAEEYAARLGYSVQGV